jgi:hypothetical protein
LTDFLALIPTSTVLSVKPKYASLSKTTLKTGTWLFVLNFSKKILTFEPSIQDTGVLLLLDCRPPDSVEIEIGCDGISVLWME